MSIGAGTPNSERRCHCSEQSSNTCNEEILARRLPLSGAAKSKSRVRQRVQDATEANHPEEVLQLAVIMPHAWRGGMLKVAIELCHRLLDRRHGGRGVRPLLCVPSHYNLKDIVGLNPDIPVVPFELHCVSSDDPRIKGKIPADRYPKIGKWPITFSLPLDESGSILSSHCWISLTGLYHFGPLLPWRPYAVFAPDFIQRYVPKIYGDDIASGAWLTNAYQNMTMFAARAVFATTPKTFSDVTVFAGVPSRRVQLFPLFHDASTGRKKGSSLVVKQENIPANKARKTTENLPSIEDMKNGFREDSNIFSKKLLERDYFVWVTNSTLHKNHANALDALIEYYINMSGNLDCYIVGPTTQFFIDENGSIPYISEISRRLQAAMKSTGKICLVGEVTAHAYDMLVARAKFIWHNVLYDNGTFSVIEAAELGTPAVVSDYPQMRFIAQAYGLEPRWFDPRDPLAAADALKQQETSGRRAAAPKLALNFESELDSAVSLLLRRLS